MEKVIYRRNKPPLRIQVNVNEPGRVVIGRLKRLTTQKKMAARKRAQRKPLTPEPAPIKAPEPIKPQAKCPLCNNTFTLEDLNKNLKVIRLNRVYRAVHKDCPA
jgi:galactose-1-phosphate uridylyltransferase